MDRDAFLAAALNNPVNEIITRELFALGLPDAWLVSGCLVQTVWNVLDGARGRLRHQRLRVFYFDPDTSWEAEDAVIRKLAARLERLSVAVETRNQARVHLWYAEEAWTALSAARLFMRQHRSIPDREYNGRHPPHCRGL